MNDVSTSEYLKCSPETLSRRMYYLDTKIQDAKDRLADLQFDRRTVSWAFDVVCRAGRPVPK